jgi:hypothetical protein
MRLTTIAIRPRVVLVEKIREVAQSGDKPNSLLVVGVIVHPASLPSESWRGSFRVSDFTVCRLDFPCTGNAVTVQFEREAAACHATTVQLQCKKASDMAAAKAKHERKQNQAR